MTATGGRHPTNNDRAQMAATHFWRLWGATNGYACLAYGGGAAAAANGKIRHTTFHPEFHSWPDDADTITRRAIELADSGYDVWSGCCLYTTRRRLAEHAIPGGWAWADVDNGWTPDTWATLTRIARGATTVIVASGGGPCKAHVYVNTPPGGDLQERNKMLRDVLGGDHKHDLATILRPPGTLNWKPNIRTGADPVVVTEVSVTDFGQVAAA